MTASAAARTAPAKPTNRKRWRPSERLVYGLAGFIVILILWESVTRLGLVKQVVLSSPTAIWTAFIKDFFTAGTIWPHIQVSATEYVAGFALAVVTGVPMGLAIGLFKKLYYLLDPWLSAIYATPTVALIPLIIIIFGIGIETKIVVVWLEAIFVVTVSSQAGVRAADAKFHDIAESFRASWWTRFRTVILPASVPFVLSGIRLGTGRALVGVVVAEFLAANQGIGFYINFSGSMLQTSRVYLGIIILGVFGITIGELVRVLERRFDRWRPAIN